MKKHTYPTYILKEIQAAVVSKIVQGSFGFIPVKGKRGPRSPDGGFYANIQDWVTKKYGHPIGQGNVYKCKQKALAIINKNPVLKKSHPAVTSIKKQTTPKMPEHRLMLYRLSLRKIRARQTIGERAFVDSMKAGYTTKVKAGIPKVQALTPKEKEATVRLYNKYYFVKK